MKILASSVVVSSTNMIRSHLRNVKAVDGSQNYTIVVIMMGSTKMNVAQRNAKFAIIKPAGSS